MKNFYVYTVFISLFLFTGNLFGQDTAGVVKKKYSKTHWSGSFKVEGFYQKGNTNKIYAVSGGEVKREDGIVETILSASLGYGESEGLKDENDFYSSFTIDLFYKNKFSPFLLQLTEYSYSRDIDLRSQSGGGIKYTFIEVPEFKSSISAAVIYDYTNLREKPGNTDSRLWRLSARFKFKFTPFGDKVTLSHFTFYQPSLKEYKNASWRSETTLAAPLTEFLAFISTYRYTHDAVVPAGVKQDDHKLTFGLEINFK